MGRIDIEVVHLAVEVMRDLEFRLDKGAIDDELRDGIG